MDKDKYDNVKMWAVVRKDTRSLWGALLFNTKAEAMCTIERSDAMPRTCIVIRVVVIRV